MLEVLRTHHALNETLVKFITVIRDLIFWQDVLEKKGEFNKVKRHNVVFQ